MFDRCPFVLSSIWMARGRARPAVEFDERSHYCRVTRPRSARHFRHGAGCEDVENDGNESPLGEKVGTDGKTKPFHASPSPALADPSFSRTVEQRRGAFSRRRSPRCSLRPGHLGLWSASRRLFLMMSIRQSVSHPMGASSCSSARQPRSSYCRGPLPEAMLGVSWRREKSLAFSICARPHGRGGDRDRWSNASRSIVLLPADGRHQPRTLHERQSTGLLRWLPDGLGLLTSSRKGWMTPCWTSAQMTIIANVINTLQPLDRAGRPPDAQVTPAFRVTTGYRTTTRWCIATCSGRLNAVHKRWVLPAPHRRRRLHLRRRPLCCLFGLPGRNTSGVTPNAVASNSPVALTTLIRPVLLTESGCCMLSGTRPCLALAGLDRGRKPTPLN